VRYVNNLYLLLFSVRICNFVELFCPNQHLLELHVSMYMCIYSGGIIRPSNFGVGSGSVQLFGGAG
jgi:hypothetical protein